MQKDEREKLIGQIKISCILLRTHTSLIIHSQLVAVVCDGWQNYCHNAVDDDLANQK